MIKVYMLLFLSTIAFGQENMDAEQYAKNMKAKLSNRDFKVSGQFSGSTRSNYIYGIDRRVDPFTYRMNARLLVQAFGINTSVNLNYGGGGSFYSLNLPSVKLPRFTRVGISPRYKWAKLHLGYRSMNFSKYTLGGHSYLGVGIDLTPGNFTLSAMYGRLKRATAEDLNTQQNLDPSFKRMGWGVKLGYKKQQDEIVIILFKAFDDPLSIPNPIARQDVLPAENAIVSMQGKKKFGKRIILDVDYALSAFTRNVNSPEILEQDGISYWEKIGGLFTPKVSSGYHKALSTDIEIKTKIGSISLGHERVDPDYRSLGSLFFQNDFENFTTGINTAMFKKQMRFASKIGWQRNNISRSERNDENRIIGSAQLNYQHNDGLGFSATYSNFRTTNKIRSNEIPIPGLIDSVFLALVNQSLNLSFNYIKGEELNTSITGNFNIQSSSTIQNDIVNEDQGNKNMMGNLAFGHQFLKSSAAVSASLLINQNTSTFTKLFSITPTIAFSKGFLQKKVKLGSAISYVYIRQNGVYFNSVIQPTANIEYKLNKKSAIRIHSSYVVRQANPDFVGANNFQELLSKMDINYKF